MKVWRSFARIKVLVQFIQGFSDISCYRHPTEFILWRESEIFSCCSVNISFLLSVSFPGSLWCDCYVSYFSDSCDKISDSHLQERKVYFGHSITGLLSTIVGEAWSHSMCVVGTQPASEPSLTCLPQTGSTTS